MKKEKSTQDKLPHTTRTFEKYKPLHIVLKTTLKISLQEKDAFLQIKKLILEIEKRYFVNVFQYYINNNHAHLFVLAPSICYLKSKLALFINQRLKRRGVFWDDRFFSSVKKSAREIIRTIHYISNQVKNMNPFGNIYSSLNEHTSYPYNIPKIILNSIGTGNSQEKLKKVITKGTLPYNTYKHIVDKNKYMQLSLF
ncbi:MAG: transposase [Oligoflexia bacterium]|nr:transposase [Oligoflexia bacterium]